MVFLINIYLDDNLDRDILITLLEKSGFQVISLRQVGMRHKNDEDHLKYASLNRLTLLTQDCDDFFTIHQRWMRKGIHHSGILLIYQSNNPRKDLHFSNIPKALNNLLALNLTLIDRIYKLNDFNY